MIHTFWNTLVLSLLFAVPTWQAHAAAQGKPYSAESCGDKVVFNCDTHQVTFKGETSKYKVDCGPSTRAGQGKLNSYHTPTVPAGSRYAAMSDADAMQFSPPLGNKVASDSQVLLHMWPAKAGKEPTGRNWGWGCLVIGPELFKILHSQCNGVPFEMVRGGSSGGRSPTSGSVPR